ncbi:aminotransferase class I/II-fold pyridoxal phosphate-dependent enzyme [Streptomyces sp. NBC_01283]|uniref:aminotransferase class I/II-fold pyridoxal phosphate-dependent enzyme n=1 Tax=Streptomyces sp. NBC_01283 TaxID=2903812 RepID=UPI00352C469A|nr:aminotransferase class I/II-fold pyridoxal phosphate-dependent enzyme [Streptomyces sp. NBC_01283]
MSPRPIETHWQGEEPATVAALLRRRLELMPDAPAYRFLTSADDAGETWTYRELDLRARAVAVGLRRENLGGKPVLLLLPPGLDYIAAFFGCLYAGALAVPAYPPNRARSGQTLTRLAAVAQDSGATHALTTRAVRETAVGLLASSAPSGLDDLCWLVSEELDTAQADLWDDPGSTADSVAFLQYTSGSTSTPKGVMVGNGNLVRNLRSIHLRLGHDEESALVSWLPPYHDMGLIGGILTPLYSGIPAHLMSPLTFVQRPLTWLETLSRTGASTSIAPNFGFEQCLQRVTAEQRAGLDLSRWRVAVNGAEPVQADTLDRFAEVFASCGFDRTALLPCYGLAEATLLVTGVGRGDELSVDGFDAAALGSGVAEPVGPTTVRTTRVVGCGTAVDGVAVAVVDTGTHRRAAEGRLGEIWVTGASVAQGYWKNPAATAETFEARLHDAPRTAWMRTGDLGFLRDGELFVAGRIKDVVIVQGRNLYPHDIERTAEEATDAIRPGNCAAFGIPTPTGEQLVLACEISAQRADEPAAVLATLRARIAEEHEVAPHAVLLLKPSTIPMTTSGKIQRRATRDALLGLSLTVVAGSVTRDEAAPEPADLTVAERRSRAADAVLRAVTALSDATDVRADDERSFDRLGIGYLALLDVVRTVEQQLGIQLPVGTLLVRPYVGTLIGLCTGGQACAPSPDARYSSDEIQAWLTARVADRLGLPVTAMDTTTPFVSLGLGSKEAVALMAELGSWLGRDLATGVVFDHPTIKEVADHLGAPAAPSTTLTTRAVRRTGPAQAATSPDEPIAVVGMGCHFPGAPDVDSYWRLLLDGRDAVTEVPPDRWDHRTVAAPEHGGFLDRVDEFDARFFGVSAREARRMDPQQRLLLETAWQTFEDAGIAPSTVAGRSIGVFVGISSHDYAELQLPDPRAVDVYSATGSAQSISANRLSYFFDLHGPSLAVDTACSSSLVSVHMACKSIRDGECDAALAGGVNLMLAPGLSVAFADGQMLAPSGRCRTFDDAADGYVRGEGAGLLCLKPLSAALADGDRIHAVIKGSAVGHGGRSNGLTAPRGTAQRAVMTRALAQAGLSAADVGYVEAHGTGTRLGDPVEWEALAGLYGRDRPEEGPCLIGSAKTNIGHLEAAAGVAGLIKAALVVRHRQVPPLLHLKTLNQRMTLPGSGLAVPTRLQELPVGEQGTARAGVSSFGFGGTNAHVIVEAAAPTTAEEPPVTSPRPAHTLCLSAHTPTALTTLARQYRTHLAAHQDTPLGDLCHSANTGRSHLSHRAALTVSTAEGLDAALEDLARDEPSTAVSRGQVVGAQRPKVAFLFSGQGTQYAGMAKELYAAHPSFAATLDRADEVLRPLIDVPLLSLLFDTAEAERLRRTRYCQPALVALEIALAELWMAFGVRPAALLGHSVGAFGAACVAGVLTLEDALLLASERGRHMEAQPGSGAMISCVGDPEAVRSAADGFASVTIAAVNTPDHLVLSGEAEEIADLGPGLTAAGITVRPLAVSHAFHSKLMAGAAPLLLAAAGGIGFREPRIPWISDATGRPVARVDADYWAEHMLGTVQFADGFAELRRMGCTAFVEIGPHPTLLNLGRSMVASGADSAPQGGTASLWLPSLRRGNGDWETLSKSLGRLHCAGGEVDWAAVDHGGSARRVPVPHTVFERERYWLATARRPVAPAHPEDTVTVVPAPLPQPAARPAPATSDVRGVVLAGISQVCGFPAEEIAPHARIGMDLGLDSLMRTDLQRRIAVHFPQEAERLKEDLPEDPTVQDLIDRLHEAGASAPSSEPAPVAAPVESVTPVKQEHSIEEWAEFAVHKDRLRQIGSSGSNPYGRTHEGFNSARATVAGQDVINFASFNYLALSHHPRVRQAAKDAIDRYGTSSSATPLLFGETPLHHELDAEIASFLGTEGAIVFAGGHATNVATVGHLFGPEDLVVHDEWIHDSTVRGAMLSGARRRPFPHNDWEALDKILGAARSRHRRALVVIEGAYSQDGDIPDLPRFIEIKRRHGAMLMIDEAHSIGVLGRTGRGVGEHFGTDPAAVDLWMGTLSKGIGSLGGYIAARGPVIEYLKYTAPLHIFSTGISPANTAAALEAFRVIRDEPERVARVQELSEYFRTGARARGLDIGVSRASAVVPVITGGWEKTMALSNSLLAQGVNVMPIGYPAVARDACRLRFFINVDHSEADLEHSLDLLV